MEMQSSWKRFLSLVLAFAMVLSYVPATVFAEDTVCDAHQYAEGICTVCGEAEPVAEEPTETPTEETEAPTEAIKAPTEATEAPTEATETPTEETEAPAKEEPEAEEIVVHKMEVTPDTTGLPSNEELETMHAYKVLYGNDVATFGISAYSRLPEGDVKKAYEALAPTIRKIANGERASTKITIGYAFDGYPVDGEAQFESIGWTYAELDLLFASLLTDMPYDLYWFDKTSNVEVTITTYMDRQVQYAFDFPVAANWAAAGVTGTTNVNTSKTGVATNAVRVAQSVVAEAASMSDYEKLVYYKDYIREACDYNYQASVDQNFSENNNPWQLIYIFDGEPTSSCYVVCEGYSKAFQYLCDLTRFDGDVVCHTVTGTMDSVNHMWNNVQIGGKTYLLDVTNVDDGTSGSDGSLFLAGVPANSDGSYTFSVYYGTDTVTYTYGAETLSWADSDVLDLADSYYDPNASDSGAAYGQADLEADIAKGDPVVVLPGSVMLERNMVIPSGVTLMIPDRFALGVPSGVKLTVNGTIIVANGGALRIQGGQYTAAAQTSITVQMNRGIAENVAESDIFAIYEAATETELFNSIGAMVDKQYAGKEVRPLNDITLTYPLTIPEGVSVYLQRATLTVPDGMTVTNNGRIAAANGGCLKILSGGTVINNGKLEEINGGTIVNEGTIGKPFTQADLVTAVNAAIYSGATQYLLDQDVVITEDLTLAMPEYFMLLIGNAKLTVAEDVDFTLDGGIIFNWGELEINGTMTVNGALTLNNGTVGTVGSNGRLINKGYFHVGEHKEDNVSGPAGTLDVYGSVENCGGYQRVHAGGEMTVYGSLVVEANETDYAGFMEVAGQLTIKNSAVLQTEMVGFDGGLYIDASATLAVENGADISAVQEHSIVQDSPDTSTVNGLPTQMLYVIMHPKTEQELKDAICYTSSGTYGKIRIMLADSMTLNIGKDTGDLCLNDGGILVVQQGVTLDIKSSYNLALILNDGAVLDVQGTLNQYAQMRVHENSEVDVSGTMNSYSGLVFGPAGYGDNALLWIGKTGVLNVYGFMGVGMSSEVNVYGTLNILPNYNSNFQGCLENYGLLVVRAGGIMASNILSYDDIAFFTAPSAQMIVESGAYASLAGQMTDPMLGTRRLSNMGNGWFEETENPVEPAYGIVDHQYDYQMFYLCTWNAATWTWTYTPVVPAVNSNNLSITKLKDMEDEPTQAGQANADYFVYVESHGDLHGSDETLNVNYYGIPYAFDFRVQERPIAFYYKPEATVDSLIRDGFRIGDNAENAVYAVLLDPDAYEMRLASWDTTTWVEGENGQWFEESLGQANVSMEKLSDAVYKFTIDPEFIEKVKYDRDEFYINIETELAHVSNPHEHETWWASVGVAPAEHHAGPVEPGPRAARLYIDGQDYFFYENSDVIGTMVPTGELTEEGHVIMEWAETTLPAGVSYDLASNTLTLNNVKLDNLKLTYAYQSFDNGEQKTAYALPKQELYLNLIGNNYIAGIDGTALMLWGNVNVFTSGSGTLTLGTDNSYNALFMTTGTGLSLNNTVLNLNFRNTIEKQSAIFINNASVVNLNGNMNNYGNLHVGYFKESSVSGNAGTLNINGYLYNTGYLNVCAPGKESGGVVNVSKMGECVNDANDILDQAGFLELMGTMNVYGTLRNESLMNMAGSYSDLNLDPAASFYNSGRLDGVVGEKTGWDINWWLENGVLTFFGAGAMIEFEDVTETPWYRLSNSVKKINLTGAITGIGDYAFIDCVNVDTVTIPEGLTTFGENTFYRDAVNPQSATKLRIPHDSPAEDLAKLYGIYYTNIHELVGGVCAGCQDYSLNDVLTDTNTTVEEKVEQIKSADTESLKQEMEKDSKTTEQIKELEKTVDTTVSVQVPEDTNEDVKEVFGTDGGNVDEDDIVGAALNAAKYETEVKLVISNPSEDTEVSEEYNTENGIVFSMTLEGVTDASALEVPVKITLPIPADIDVTKLAILHYHGDGEPVVLRHTLSADKKSVSFVLSGFSDFAMVERVNPEVIPTFSRSMQAFLTLENEVYLNVAYTFENLAELDREKIISRSGILVWDADKMPAEADAVYENCDQIYDQPTYNDGKSRFEVRTPGIPAKELGDGICFRAYYQCEDGSYIYGRIISNYSPKKYCYGQLKDASAADDALMIAILNYGAAAQSFFEYGLEDLMNADLTEEQKALHWDGSLVRSDWSVPVEKEGSLTRNKAVITGRGGYLSLLGAIDYNYYAKVSSSVTVAKAEMLIWNEADYNAAGVLTEENASSVYTMQYSTEKGRYEFKYKGLAAKEMFHPVYACARITDDAGNVYYSGVVAYSPERFAYISSTSSTVSQAEANLAKRLAIYGDAARTFFNK